MKCLRNTASGPSANFLVLPIYPPTHSDQIVPLVIARPTMSAAMGSGLPSLPSPTILASVAGTNASPGSLLLLPFTAPNPSSPLLNLKPYVSSPKHGTVFLPPNVSSNTDGLVITSEEGKNVIFIHHIPCAGLGIGGSSSNSTATNRLIAPEKVVSLALSPDGSLLAVGCPNGHAYLYELSSGDLMASWEPHFRAVQVLRFSPDGACLASGGQDGRVCVWSIAGLISPEISSSAATSYNPPKAYATFTSHLLSITDLHFSPSSAFAFPYAGHLWSSSEDGTLRLWDIRTRSLLTNFEFKNGSGDKMGAVNAFVPDPSGRFCFAAVSYLQSDKTSSSNTNTKASSTSGGGRVFRIDLYRRHGTASDTFSAVGGGGLQDVEQVGGGSTSSTSGHSHAHAHATSSKKQHIELSSTPISLSLTPSTSHLLIGTAKPPTPTLHIVDVPSLQIIRSVGMDAAGVSEIRSLDVFYRHVPSSTSGGGALPAPAGAHQRSEKRVVASQLSRSLANYQSNGNDDEDQDDVFWTQIPSGPSDYDEEHPYSATTATARASATPAMSIDQQQNTESIPQTASQQHQHQPTLSSEQNHDLRTELDTLRSQLQQASQWNKEMWKHVVQSTAAIASREPKDTPTSDDPMVDVHQKGDTGAQQHTQPTSGRSHAKQASNGNAKAAAAQKKRKR